jgi:hypothetical protein
MSSWPTRFGWLCRLVPCGRLKLPRTCLTHTIYLAYAGSGLARSRLTRSLSCPRVGPPDPHELARLACPVLTPPPISRFVEYKDLETRVDALKNVHTQMLKITGVYQTESYDYPTQIVESVGEGFGQLSYGFNTFAQKNLKVYLRAILISLVHADSMREKYADERFASVTCLTGHQPPAPRRDRPSCTSDTGI